MVRPDKVVAMTSKRLASERTCREIAGETPPFFRKGWVDRARPLEPAEHTRGFELDRPYWVQDAPFDLDYHVRHIGLGPPGAADQLAEHVARIVGRRMDRRLPCGRHTSSKDLRTDVGRCCRRLITQRSTEHPG